MTFSVLLAVSFDGGLTFNIDRAMSHGISRDGCTMLVEVNGVANIIGRILFGQIADMLSTRIYLLTTITLVVFVGTWLTSVFATSLTWQVVWFAVFGILNGANSTFATVLLKYVSSC